MFYPSAMRSRFLRTRTSDDYRHKYFQKSSEPLQQIVENPQPKPKTASSTCLRIKSSPKKEVKKPLKKCKFMLTAEVKMKPKIKEVKRNKCNFLGISNLPKLLIIFVF